MEVDLEPHGLNFSKLVSSIQDRFINLSETIRVKESYFIGHVIKRNKADIKSWQEMNYNKFNQVSSSSWTQDAVKQWKECDVLDKLQGAFSN